MKGFQEGLHRGLEETGAAGAFDNPGTFRYNKRDYLPEKRPAAPDASQAKKKTGWRAGRTTAAAATGA